jgi:hypothetical protein
MNLGIWGYFPGANGAGREAHHSPRTSAEIKKKVNPYTCIHSPKRLQGVVCN